MDTRQQQLKAWLLKLAAKHSLDPEQLEIASADASFRRYFRVVCQDQRKSLIVMDAPPAHEDVRPFVAVARLFADAGMTTPAIVEEAP